MIERLIDIFENSNNQFLSKDMSLIKSEVSERTLCGALMQHLSRNLYGTEFEKYHVDVEYNRNKNGTLKTCIKTITGLLDEIITINCDLIVHSRGEIVEQDNLIAIEMKKSNRPPDEKDKDRYRLMALTKDSYDEIWSFDGKTLPEHVCRYGLGVYYEINYAKNEIKLEYYQKGHLFDEKKIVYKK